MSPAEADDSISLRIDDLFAHLLYRQVVFGEFYPFELNTSGNNLIKKEEVTGEQKLYLFLLLASSFRYLEGSDRNTLATDFELLCREALKAYLPDKAEVHVFGTSAKNTTLPRYTGTLWDKINRLAADLYEGVKVKETSVSPNNTGDEGLDLVAWIPIGDEREGMLIVFGQCACTDKWVSKQNSSGAVEWRQKMSFKVEPSNFVFIPFFFRRTDGSWHEAHKISSILIDRLRLIRLLKEKFSFLESLPTATIVENAIQQRQPIF